MALVTSPEKENLKNDKSDWHNSDQKHLDTDKERTMLETDSSRKVFCHRNSLLTDLMKEKHARVVQSISISFFIFLIISADFFYTATPNLLWDDILRIVNAASKVSVFCTVWISLNVSCVVVYYVFKWWTLQRIKHQKKNKLLDVALLLLYVTYLVLTFAVPPFCVMKFQVPTITTLALLCEQTRILMKIYSFIRESVSSVLKVASGKGEDIPIQSLCPTFKHFLYYFFVPTLIYRDSYPRTSTIQWRFVITNVLQGLACLFNLYCIIYRFNVDVFRNTGRVKFEPSYLALTTTGSMIFGTLIFVFTFYGFSHCWLNLCAEILKFGDRQFYQNWWSSTSLFQFYRRVDCVIYDWLHTYVDMEFQKMGYNDKISVVIGILISAVVHEFIFSFSLGIFLPAFFLVYSTFAVSVLFSIKKQNTKVWNIMMHVKLPFGCGFMAFFYSIEWFARVNCPRSLDEYLDFFIPRFWRCNILSMQ